MPRYWMFLNNEKDQMRVTKFSREGEEEEEGSASAIALQPSVIINVFSTPPSAMCPYT